ncbi:IMPACT family protein [Candidatus Pelagadaptatus aseana]|uniref:IMPACT family protein n=1 Tax=Candidatus Pelagadaptatus aseana TaxID=3120508 RepID=UPI003C6F3083
MAIVFNRRSENAGTQWYDAAPVELIPPSLSVSAPVSYFTPAQAVEVEYEIKKSRFIARVAEACSREEAMDLLEQARIDYPDARHHCWAYLVGPPLSPSTVASSDDGEPSGTAGKPILNVLEHKGVGNVMLVVIRYFGGIKLGAGGLVRAYSQAAQMAMEALPKTLFEPRITCRVAIDFALEQSLRHWLSGHKGDVTEHEYHEQVILTLALPHAQLPELQAFLAGKKARFLNEDN